MGKIFITREIPEAGINALRNAGHDVEVSAEDRVLLKSELIAILQKGSYDALLALLTDKIDSDVIGALGPNCKIVANYAVGYDNIDLKAAETAGVIISNTPGVLTETVAEHTFALMLAISHRIAEADRFTREGKYTGWAPKMLLGNDLSHKTIGIVGLGRIGSRVAHHASKGFDARIVYYDVTKNAEFEKETGATFFANLDELLREADYVSIHVPLIPATKYLINRDRLKIMKSSAYLINTSRGPVVDEIALVDALRTRIIKGAALDVFESEPQLSEGLADLDNVILTPHIASATEETRNRMSLMAADNIIAVLEGKEPPQRVKLPS